MLLRSNRWIALVFVVGLALPAFGQDSVDLQWKFEEGKTFYQEMTTTTKQTMKVMGMDITQNHSQTFYFSWTPLKKDGKDGSWTVKQKIVGVKMDIEISGNKISYDSTKDTGTGSSLAEFFKALVGTEFTLTISPKMEITKIDGREEFLKKLAQTNPMMEPLLKQILGEEALKQMADPAFAVAPGKVEKGKPWERKATMNMGPIGKYDAVYKYTYEGPEGKDSDIAKIKQETTLNYSAPAGDTGTVLPFKIKGADLKSKDASGTIRFDVKKGRVEDSDLKMKLDGKLTIDIGGSTTEVDLSQEQTTKLKTTDKDPTGKAEAPPGK